MSLRALVLGLLLGIGIAAFTHFNDRIIGQTMLVGNHLPPAVFGFAVVLLLGVNPLLRSFGKRWPLRAGEMALVLAMGLAVCGWPGSNFFRHFMHVMVLPGHQARVQPAWQAQEVFSYVPGGSPRLAEGYIADWHVLTSRFLDQASEPADDRDAADEVVERVWDRLGDTGQRVIRELAETPHDTAGRRLLISQLNNALEDADLIPPTTLANLQLPARAGPLMARLDTLDAVDRVALNRAALESAMPGALRPPPAGAGLLLTTDRIDTPTVEPLLVGADEPVGVTQVPWAEWWPVLRLWGGLGLLLALGSLCLVLVVHPQWSRHELLPYPTVRFIEEATKRTLGRTLPDITFAKMFWLGLAVAGGIHLLNGLYRWFPDWPMPQVDLNINMTPLRDLFPNASRVPHANSVFQPTIFLSVVGFGFFVATRVSFSLGVSSLLWLMLGSAVVASGATFTTDRFSVGGAGPSMRFGAFIGLTGMILYFGRWYYLRAIQAAAGLGRPDSVPISAVWGLRGLIVCSAAAVFLLTYYAGLDWPLSVLIVGMLFMVMLVLTRVNVETGLYFAQTDWLPGVILLSFFGAAALGPEALIIVTLAGVVLVGAPREAVMPFLANAWALNDRLGKQPAGRSFGVIGMMLLVGFVVALLAVFLIHYNEGLSPDTWPPNMARSSIQTAAVALSELSAAGTLTEVTGNSFTERLSHLRPAPGMIPWTLLGLALVLGCAVAALRLPWWPLHPVLFVVWGTYPLGYFAGSFLIAAVIKQGVVSCAGEKGYHGMKPMMIGLIAGELLMILVWSVVGAIYYFNMGLPPSTYQIAPP